jgi:hypothetical protein
MVFIEPSIFTEIGGPHSMRRSKQLDYELESKHLPHPRAIGTFARTARRAGFIANKTCNCSSGLNLRNATNPLPGTRLQHALGGEIS